MIKSSKINNLKFGSGYQFLLLAMAFIIPFIEFFEIQIASIILILLLIWWLISFSYKVKLDRLLKNKIVFLFVLLYLIQLHGLFIEADNNIVQKLLIKKAAILLFPLIIGTSPSLDFSLVKKSIYLFTGSLVINTIITFSQGVEGLILSPDGLADLANKITIHRPFFGLFCAFAILALLYLIIQMSKLSKKFITLIISVYLLGFILFIYAKMTFVALILAFLILSFLWMMKRGKYLLLLAFCSFLIISMYSSYHLIPTVKGYINVIKDRKDFSYTDHNILIVGSINVRYINWGCALQTIKENDNWIFGVGAGGAQAKLQECYKGANPWIYENKMNTHNQFLEEILYNGVLGLLIFLSCIIIPAGIAYKQNNFLYLGFILIFAFCCLTENILSRSIGIFYYSFFNSILYFNKRRYDQSSIKNNLY